MRVDARIRSLALLLVASLAAACGSTAQQALDSQGAAAALPGAPAADGLSAPVTPGEQSLVGGPVPGAAAGAAPGTLASGTAGQTGGGAQAPGSAPGGVTTGQVAGASGPGVTAKEIYVGLIYDENAGAVNQAAGVGSITTGNTREQERAIIADINSHGGVAGRKLVPVFARFDSTSPQTLDQQFAAICAQFTNDEPRVFAVLENGTESFRSCLAKAGVSILSDDLPSVGQAELDRVPGFIEQGYPNLDRLAAYQVTPLVAQKYFTPWNTVTGEPAATGKAKVGIYTYDDRVFAGAVDRFLVPALKRLGYEPEVAKIAQVNTASDYSQQAAAVKAAQLRFASNGVTHVIPFEGNGGLSVFFLANARSQGYYPRYGISTASGFQALLDTGAYEAKQMNGAMGYGWMPAVDLPSKYNPDDGPYSNPNRRHCLKVMKGAGIEFTSGNAQQIALSECASLYLLQVALAKTPAQVVRSTFVRAVESLGTSYQKAGGLGQEFKPGRHDPANRAYHWKYFTDCGCFHYEGPLQTIP